ncbi:hypothetical protein ACFLVI_03835 [Chloroflexota bacterium]
MINLRNFCKNVAFKLDKFLAILGLFIGLILIYVSFSKDNYVYIVVGILLLSACTAYLLIDTSKNISYGISELQVKRSIYLLLNTLFFLAFCYSIISLYLASDPYTRPMSYFISIIFMVSILAIEILFLPRDKYYTLFILAKIMLIPLSLVWSQSLIYPTVLGDDPRWHMRFTEDLLDSGFIPEGLSYSRLPFMHLLIGITSQVTGLGYKIATMLAISSTQIICLVSFIFLLGRCIFSANVGLLAALILGITSHFLRMAYWPIPYTLGIIFVPIVIYLLLKIYQNRPMVSYVIVLFFMASVILTHTLASVSMAVVFFVLWIAFAIYYRIYGDKGNTGVTFNGSILFLVAMLSWWMYASGHITHLARLIDWGFSEDLWAASITTPTDISQHTYKIPFAGRLFSTMGTYLFWSISAVGCLYMISNKVKNPSRYAFAVCAMAIAAMIFVCGQLSLAIFTDRWHFLAEILFSIPCAVSLLLFASVIKKVLLKTLYVAGTVAVISFLMIMNPTSNMDNPLFRETGIRKASMESELQANETISQLTSLVVGVGIDPVAPNLQSLYSKYFTDYLSSVITIREAIHQETIQIKGDSFIRLNYSPTDYLAEEGFSHIYATNSVDAFYWTHNLPE